MSFSFTVWWIDCYSAALPNLPNAKISKTPYQANVRNNEANCKTVNNQNNEYDREVKDRKQWPHLQSAGSVWLGFSDRNAEEDWSLTPDICNYKIINSRSESKVTISTCGTHGNESKMMNVLAWKPSWRDDYILKPFSPWSWLDRTVSSYPQSRQNVTSSPLGQRELGLFSSCPGPVSNSSPATINSLNLGSTQSQLFNSYISPKVTTHSVSIYKFSLVWHNIYEK